MNETKKQQVYAFIQSRPAAQSAAIISDRFELSEAECAEILSALCDEGYILPTKKMKYTTPARMDLTAGRVMMNKNGTCFVRPVGEESPDIFIDRREEQPMNGDIALVSVFEEGDRPRGDIVSIIKRKTERMLCVLEVHEDAPAPEKKVGHSKQKKGAKKPVHKKREYRVLARPLDERMRLVIKIDEGKSMAAEGRIAMVEITRWPAPGGDHARGVIIESFGQMDDLPGRMDALMMQWDIPRSFPEEVLSQASALGDAVSPTDIAGRLDLRGDVIFTIDGDDAKDFDDAVSLTVSPEGKQVLGVHIADVSHYVVPGSALDDEAIARGTSVYLPGITVPMLPEALSNGLCSLRPNEDRLAFSLIMTLGSDACVESYLLRKSVIRSCARLTYNQVNRMLAGEENDVPETLHSILHAMNALKDKRTSLRAGRGSIDLEMPEAKIIPGEDLIPLEISARVRGQSERLIEEFMLLANETVAAHAKAAEIPFPYRIHEKPDPERLQSLEEYLHDLGISVHLGSEPLPMQLNQLLLQIAGHPSEMPIKSALLRSMSRARYKDEPLGHYALATSDYCHFTSPIRRYPDLMAHRMLAILAENGSFRLWRDQMSSICDQSSDREYCASMCERDADSILMAAYMSERIGEVYPAVVTRIRKKDISVRLDNLIEGMIPAHLIPGYFTTDDRRRYLIFEKSRDLIRLGDPVQIRVSAASIQTGELEFELIREERKERKERKERAFLERKAAKEL